MCLGLPSDVQWGLCFLIFLLVWLTIIGILSSGHSKSLYVGVRVMLLHALVLAVLGGASEGEGPPVCYGLFAFFAYMYIASKNADANERAKWVEEANATVDEARANGAVNLEATNYNGKYAKFLGVFDPMLRTAQGRPLYKRHVQVENKDVFLFHSEKGYWMVGRDWDTNRGSWQCASDEKMPYNIKTTWQTIGGDGEWVDQTVKISLQMGDNAATRGVLQMGDNTATRGGLQMGDNAATITLLMV